MSNPFVEDLNRIKNAMERKMEPRIITAHEDISEEYIYETIKRMKKLIALIKDDEKYIQALGTFTILTRMLAENVE